VTDDWDRRGLLSLLDDMYCPSALENPDFRINGIKVPPTEGVPFSRQDFLDYIEKSLETRDAPEIFGLHRNAGLTLLRRQAGNMLGWLVSLQPGITTSDEVWR
jgi:dynein heavy chain